MKRDDVWIAVKRRGKGNNRKAKETSRKEEREEINEKETMRGRL